MKNIKKGFPPIADKWAKVLILGSIPGEESLRRNEYYANPRNVFWKIMAILFAFEQDTNYEKRLRILKKNKIALWDVLHACERQGSLDSAINDRAMEENKFHPFYRRHLEIRHVFFNGTKAANVYFKKVLPMLPEEDKGIEYFTLPSTSPAMARLSFDAKLIEWSMIKRIVQGM